MMTANTTISMFKYVESWEMIMVENSCNNIWGLEPLGYWPQERNTSLNNIPNLPVIPMGHLEQPLQLLLFIGVNNLGGNQMLLLYFLGLIYRLWINVRKWMTSVLKLCFGLWFLTDITFQWSCLENKDDAYLDSMLHHHVHALRWKKQ